MNISKKTRKLLKNSKKLATWHPVHMKAVHCLNSSLDSAISLEGWRCSSCNKIILYPINEYHKCPRCGKSMYVPKGDNP